LRNVLYKLTIIIIVIAVNIASDSKFRLHDVVICDDPGASPLPRHLPFIASKETYLSLQNPF